MLYVFNIGKAVKLACSSEIQFFAEFLCANADKKIGCYSDLFTHVFIYLFIYFYLSVIKSN